jgi:hypothetical protein
MTSHDITFCGNSDECPKAPTCRRAHPPGDVRVSLAAFYMRDTHCSLYWPEILGSDYLTRSGRMNLGEKK